MEHASTNPASDDRAGLTLVEVLVALGVVALLLALSAPGLRGARVRTGETRSLSNAKGIAADLQQFVTHNDERFPALQLGEFYQSNFGGAPIRVAVPDRWQSARFWPVIIRSVVPWEERLPAWVGAGADLSDLADRSFVPAYEYANSFVAPPRVWSDSPPPAMPTSPLESRNWDVRAAQVAFPASKALLWDGEQTYNPRPAARLMGGLPGGPTPMAFADGHAALHMPSAATRAIENGLNTNPWRASSLHNTPGGVLGRDY